LVETITGENQNFVAFEKRNAATAYEQSVLTCDLYKCECFSR